MDASCAVVFVKALKECEQLMQKQAETSAKNDQLSTECRRYEEQFRRMEEKIANLKREIDERNRQASFTDCYWRNTCDSYAIKYSKLGYHNRVDEKYAYFKVGEGSYVKRQRLENQSLICTEGVPLSEG